jgi:hypothetical protein
MQLYDLRREATMREGRDWFVAFFPSGAQDIIQAMVDPKTSGYYRMVVSYWDMAASFVNRGAIDEEMFMETCGESMMVFAKIEPFVDEVRTILGNPRYAKNLEALAMRMPDAKEALAARREMLSRMIEARADMAESAYSK